MVNFILEIGEEKTKVKVPNSWADISFLKYVELLNNDNGDATKIVSILTGIDIETILKLNANDFAQIANVCFFVYDKQPLLDNAKIPKKYENWLIGDQSWGKFEEAKQAIISCGETDSFNAASELVRIYDGRDISSENILDVIGIASFFLSNYMTFMNDLNSYKKTKVVKKKLKLA